LRAGKGACGARAAHTTLSIPHSAFRIPHLHRRLSEPQQIDPAGKGACGARAAHTTLSIPHSAFRIRIAACQNRSRLIPPAKGHAARDLPIQPYPFRIPHSHRRQRDPRAETADRTSGSCTGKVVKTKQQMPYGTL